MNLLAQIKFLIRKEIVLEWRSKYALNGILLYVVSTVFVCFLSFRSIEQATTWNALFWIIMLFASVNAIAKSFVQENRSRQLYYYTLASPHAIILAKILYNVLLMILLAVVAIGFYSIVFKNPIGDLSFYFLSIFLGSISFASVFTMISGIASKANNGALMAILSFPVIIPLLMLLIKFSKNAMDGLDRSVSYNEIGVLVAINMMVVMVSLLLFPYLWRE